MNHYLKIDGYCVPEISSIVVGEFFRNESRLTTFSGGIAVDRGSPKLQVTVRIRRANLTQIEAIEEKLAPIILPAEFYYRGEIVQRSMVSSPISTYRVEYPELSEKSPYYRAIEFTLEEQ